MPVAEVGGMLLSYEEYGTGVPIVWCHEYYGDRRSWAPQLTRFSRHYRNVVYSARGYPGSSEPTDASSYSQDLMIGDLRGLLDYLEIDKAVVAGLSMGGNVALNFGLRHPDRCIGLVVAGCGSGSTNRQAFEDKANALIDEIEHRGAEGLAGAAALDPTRATFQEKDPAGFSEFLRRLLDRSPAAAAHVYREVQLKRPGILTLTEQLRSSPLPALIIFGDQDSACVDPGLHMWREMPGARLAVFPHTGHCVNLEEPELFNDIVETFVAECTPS